MTSSSTFVSAPLNTIPADITCAYDYELLASQFIAADRLAYISGGSGFDVTVNQNRLAFSDYAIVPSMLKDVSDGGTRFDLCGDTFAHPMLLAPVAYQTLIHPQGELATAYAAASTDTCMVASTLSSYDLESIAQHAGEQRWFQLYFQADDKDTDDLVKRAVAAGYKAIVVTVDASIQLPSTRAIRAGFIFPQDVQAANLIHQSTITSNAKQSVFEQYMQNAVTPARLERLIASCPLPVIVKGVLNPQDAVSIKNMGAQSIIVSNHGGRTIDNVPSSLECIRLIRQAVGEGYPLLLDSGIRSGTDVFKAMALGANAVLIGRLQLYALSVAGPLGVAHMIKLLRQEFELAMAMTGCRHVNDINETFLLNKRG
jgi:isopentenyl diphosphate isomerase/L-lactate dehydrogenase-like FMN-dependent dehydrogenase